MANYFLDTKDTMKYLIKPWAHQLTAINICNGKRDFGLFFEQGAGKTLTVINIARQKYYDNGRLLRTLVLCPPIVRRNWVREWSSNSVLSKKVLMLDGPGRNRAKAVRKLSEGDVAEGSLVGGSIIITNYESLRNEELKAELLSWRPELIIYDESHKCKTHNSRTTKDCYELARGAKHRFILTGTPVLNSPSDLFSQFKIMDLGETFGTKYFAFRAEYFVDKNAGMPRENYFPNWQPRPNLEVILNAKIQEKSMRVLKKDCMDLPPRITQRVDIPLSRQQQIVYDQMKQDFVAYVGSESCVATMALTKALRLLQISTGFVSLEDDDGNKTEKIFKDNGRDAALEELLSEIVPQEKVIVWAVFKRNYDSIRAVCKKLGIEIVEVHGGITDKNKQENVDRFNSVEGPRVLLGHPASAGIGINLVTAPYSVRYSRSFNLGDFLQSRDRNYRGGSEVHECVTEIELIAPGTLDEYVYECLGNKQDLAGKILDLAGMV